MVTEDKIIEIFCLDYDLCKLFHKLSKVYNRMVQIVKMESLNDGRMDVVEIVVIDIISIF